MPHGCTKQMARPLCLLVLLLVLHPCVGQIYVANEMLVVLDTTGVALPTLTWAKEQASVLITKVAGTSLLDTIDKNLLLMQVNDSSKLEATMTLVAAQKGIVLSTTTNDIIIRPDDVSTPGKRRRRLALLAAGKRWGFDKISYNPSMQEWIDRTKFVKVCIVDGGIDVDHQDLKGRIRVKINAEFNNDNVQPVDDHTTLIAGIIAGEGPLGGTRMQGINPQADLIVCTGENKKTTAKQRDGTIVTIFHHATVGNVLECFRRCRDAGAQVINYSGGIDKTGPRIRGLFEDQLNELQRAGVPVVLAAGNGIEGQDLQSHGQDLDKNAWHCPVCLKHPAATVVTNTGQRDALPVDADYGRVTVHLAAPGEEIYSCSWKDSSTNSYSYNSGTSFAAPFVTGAASLLMAATTLDSKTIMMAIQQSVDRVPGLPVASEGRFNIDKALRKAIMSDQKLCPVVRNPDGSYRSDTARTKDNRIPTGYIVDCANPIQNRQQSGTALVSAVATGIFNAMTGGGKRKLLQTGSPNAEIGWDLRSWYVSLDLPGSDAASTTSSVVADVMQAVPFLLKQDKPADKSNWLVTANAFYDSSRGLVQFVVSTSNALFLLNDFTSSVFSNMNITLPVVHNTPADAATGSVAIESKGGGSIESISIAVAASWNISQIGTRLGYEWPLSASLLTIANPSIAVVPATKTIRVDVTLSVPKIGVTNTKAAVQISGKQQVALELSGNVALFGGVVTMTNIKLSAVKGTGLVGAVSASFAGLPLSTQFTVRDVVPNGKASVMVSMSGTNIGAGDVLNMMKRLWPAAANMFSTTELGQRFPQLKVDSADTTNGAVVLRAGPVNGLAATLAADGSGLRLVKVGLSSTLGLTGLAARVGVTPPTDLGDLFSITNANVTHVRRDSTGAGFADVDVPGSALIAPGTYLSFKLRVPLLMGNTAPPVDSSFRIMDGNGTITTDWSFQLPGSMAVYGGVVTMSNIKLTAVKDTGLVGAFSASFSGLPLSTQLTLRNTVPAGQSRVRVSMSGTNIGVADVLSVMKNLWPVAANMFSTAEQGLRFPQLNVDSMNSTDGVVLRAGPVNGLVATLVVDNSGVRLVKVGLASNLDLSGLAGRVGVPLPVDLSGIISVANPTVTYVRKGSAGEGFADVDVPGSSSIAPGTYLSFQMKVPLLMGDTAPAVNCNFRIMDGDGNVVTDMTLEWQGSYSPVQHITLNGARLSLRRGTGLVGSVAGTIANSMAVQVDVLLADAAAQTAGRPKLAIVAVARSVSPANVLSTLFPSTPPFIVDLLRPIAFTELRIMWDSSSAARFGVAGQPNISNVASLKAIMDFLQFNPEDLQLSAAADNPDALQFALQKSWTFNPGAPFEGPSTVKFALATQQQGASTTFSALAEFQAGIRIDILDPPVVQFGLKAGVGFETTAGVTFRIAAIVTSKIQIKGFPFIQLLGIGGDITCQPLTAPPFVNVKKAEFWGTAVVLTTEVSAAMVYDQARGLFGVSLNVDQFDLQATLGHLGVNVNLGPFNLRFSQVQLSYANLGLTVGTVSIPQGLFVKGSMSFMGINFSAAFQMDANGLSLQARIPAAATPLKIINDALAAVQSILDALKINVKVTDLFKLNHFDVSLVLTKTRIAFGLGVSMRVAGNDINPSFLLQVDDPMTQIVNLLKDKILEPLTAACTKDSYGRGAGVVPSVCNGGRERDGALCYNRCPTDWQYGSYGVASTCYQNCPPGYRDDFGNVGLTCSYVGCNSDEDYDGAGICYKKCPAGYSRKIDRCYKNCDWPWYDDLAGTSCQSNYCDWGEEDNGAGMCYPGCAGGYHSNGLTMCIQSWCPDGYRNDPLSCWRDYASYGKGCCCTWFGCCNRGCNPGFVDDGGCLCVRWADLIWKHTYDRGAGRPKFRTAIKYSYQTGSRSAINSFGRRTQWRDPYSLECPTWQDTDAGLCYNKCGTGYHGVGPVCWQSKCPTGTTDCGSYCAPVAFGGCANFVGAVWQNCVTKYGPATARKATPLRPTNATTITPEQAQLSVTNKAHKLGCTKDASCFCNGSAVGVYAHPSNEKSYIICELNKSSVEACPGDTIFNATMANCHARDAFKTTLTITLKADCTDKENGVYIPDPKNVGTAYKCVNGTVLQHVCPTDMIWSAAKKKCVAETKPKAMDPNCKSLDCFCKGKKPGSYADFVTKNTKKYVQCGKAGAAIVKACPEKLGFHGFWNRAKGACGLVQSNVTAVVTNCNDESCYCIGRDDGTYSNPFNVSTGIHCSFQTPNLIGCPEGYTFKAKAKPFCQGTKKP